MNSHGNRHAPRIGNNRKHMSKAKARRLDKLAYDSKRKNRS